MTYGWRIPFHIEHDRLQRTHLIDTSKWLTECLCLPGKVVNSQLARRDTEAGACKICHAKALARGLTIPRETNPPEEMSLREMARDENRYLNRQQAKENNKCR